MIRTILRVLVVILAITLSSQAVRLLSSDAIEQDVRRLLERQAHLSDDVPVLIQLASRYLDLGDELTEPDRRRAAYDEGARIAKRALALDDATAEAHYLYAANMGSAAQLSGMMAGALTVREIKRHVRRALELRPNHPPSLHMMGMMLEELPWVLGGNSAAALEYLQRAVAADPGYLHARLDLAKMYVKRQQHAAARQELETIVASSPRSDRGRRFVAEARQLLEGLPHRPADR